uniref:multivesicular body subunit 12B-like isoform X2 n=1 Tax=Myxine glutinosa TaxID=7769 RepID=UPI00358F69E2
MPEVNHLWQTSSAQEPITALGVVASRAATPHGYTLLMCTPDGADADLWKGGLFKGKSTRYLCFTRNYTNHSGVSTEVISDIRLVDEKDTVPIDYIALLETLDTKEPALQKKWLCIQTISRQQTEAAVADLMVSAKTRQAPSSYNFVGSVNGLGIWYKMGPVPKPRSLPPTPHRSPAASAMRRPPSLLQELLPKHGVLRSSWPDRPPDVLDHRGAASQAQLDEQATNIYSISALDGVPFVLSEKYDDPRKKYEYSFVTERNAIVGAPTYDQPND